MTESLLSENMFNRHLIFSENTHIMFQETSTDLHAPTEVIHGKRYASVYWCSLKTYFGMTVGVIKAYLLTLILCYLFLI